MAHAPPPTHLIERLSAPGPKRILSLDGGGIRGLITLGFLSRLEELLRQRSGNPEMVLSDYFDLIGGTSTGALIAASLSLGWPVEKVVGLYHGLARDVFRPRRSLLGPLARLVGSKFDEKPLAEAIRTEIGGMRLDDEAFRCGLVVMAKRADTASVWQLTNVPGHRFYEMNRHIRLWEVLRASSAAPTYFDPQRMDDVGAGESAVFVDGSVSMHSNPALQMFMVASLEGFGLQWAPGADRILLCSVGTGAFDVAPSADSIRGYRQVQWLGQLMVQLLREGSDLGETLLQWMSASPTAREIDLQVGDLAGDQLGPEPMLTYLRYDVPLTVEGLAAVGENVDEGDLSALRALDGAEHVVQLERIGRAAAAVRVADTHLPAAFDVEGAGAASAGGRAPSAGTSPSAPTSPVLGVTGHRPPTLPDEGSDVLSQRVDEVLSTLTARGFGTLVTGLAEGADRLVAGRALARGWAMQALLPMDAEPYEADFADGASREDFRALLARADRVEVVPSADEPYFEQGARLVDRSQALLAIWDGEPARGPGGTGEVVVLASEAGVPVVWIHAHAPHEVRVVHGGSIGEPLAEPIAETLADTLAPLLAERP